MALFVLYESASGYGLFEVVESEEIGSVDDEVCLNALQHAGALLSSTRDRSRAIARALLSDAFGAIAIAIAIANFPARKNKNQKPAWLALGLYNVMLCV